MRTCIAIAGFLPLAAAASGILPGGDFEWAAKGMKEGMAKGLEEGMKEGRTEILKLLIASGMPIDEVAQRSGLTIDEVVKLTGSSH